MANVVVKTPMQYLDRATSALKQIGITPPKGEDAPINACSRRSPTSSRTRSPSSPARWARPGLQRGRARADAGHGDRRALPGDHRGLQLHPRRRQEDGRPDRRRQDRPPRAGHQRLDEDRARRHRRPLRRDQGDVSRRDALDQGPDRARKRDPRGLPGFPRRAEAGRGAGARGAEDWQGRSWKRPRPSSAKRRRPSRASPARSRPSAPSSSWPATSSCGAPRTRRSATRSPRTSPTT